MAMLQDGQSRVIRRKPWCLGDKDAFRITAIRVDSETPYVQLDLKDPYTESVTTRMLTDSEAEELARQITKALGYLPSSK